MKPAFYLFKVWRFAWARDRYSSIGGWKQLWYRLWWDLRWVAPIGITRVIIPPKYTPPKVLHWPVRANATGILLHHWCGAVFSEPWCERYEDTTCQECRRRGAPAYLKYKVGTR